MKCLSKIVGRNYDDKGNMILSLEVPYFKDQVEIKGLRAESDYILELTEYDKRTLDQNKYLWRLIGLISKKLGQKDDETYLAILKGANAKSEYIQLMPEALPMLKRKFRAIELIEERGKSNLYRVYYGTSNMTKNQFNDVLEETFRVCAELGINYEIEGY